MAGKKGSSPAVYKYYKVSGEKVERVKNAQDAARVYSCPTTKIDEVVASVVLQNLINN
jgi:hypothetical protein